jgi:hypothetical protein
MNREDEIKKIAYHMWDLEGRPEGRTLEYWLLAESIWEINQQSQNKKPDDMADMKPASTQKKEQPAGTD